MATIDPAAMSLRFQDIDSLPIGVSHDDVASAFRPFHCTGNLASAGARRVRRIRWNAFKRATRRAFGRRGSDGNRGKEMIEGEYESAWARGYSAYDLSAGCRKPQPWLDRGTRFMADRAGVPRYRNVILHAVINGLKPSRVLEVGCGNGINLLLLAGQFPGVSFVGLELTEAGTRVAREMQLRASLPSALSAYAVYPAADPAAFRRIEFVRGDATCMPFGDAEFDLVFTVLSIEQMERVRDEALFEIARVSGKHVLHLEPFAEANRSLLRRAHVFGRDYFRGSINDLPRYDLNPAWATMDFPQEIQLGAALVLSRKSRDLSTRQ